MGGTELIIRCYLLKSVKCLSAVIVVLLALLEIILLFMQPRSVFLNIPILFALFNYLLINIGLKITAKGVIKEIMSIIE